jgi:hypothetical protein
MVGAVFFDITSKDDHGARENAVVLFEITLA